MNLKNKVLNYFKKDKEVFVLFPETRPWYKTKSFIYNLYSNIKIWVVSTILAPIKNHKKYLHVRNILINILFTTTIFFIILKCFGMNGTLVTIKVSSGIAVTLATMQYYIVWYYSIKK